MIDFKRLEPQNATKLTKNNVNQCWKCRNQISQATFKDVSKDGKINFIILPECGKYHCYITELSDDSCKDFCSK